MLQDNPDVIRSRVFPYEALDRHVRVRAQVEHVHRPHVARHAVEGGAAIRERHTLRTLKRVAVAAGVGKGVAVVEFPVPSHVKGFGRAGFQEFVGRKDTFRDAHVVDLALERV